MLIKTFSTQDGKQHLLNTLNVKWMVKICMPLPPLRAADKAYTLELCVTRSLWKVLFCLESLKPSLVTGCCSSFTWCSVKSTPLFVFWQWPFESLELVFKRYLHPFFSLLCAPPHLFWKPIGRLSPSSLTIWLLPPCNSKPRMYLYRSWGNRHRPRIK